LLWTMLDAGSAAAGDALRADYQSQGRGQRGSTWLSEPGQNLLISFLLQPRALTASGLFGLLQAAALGVASACQMHTEAQIEIKWPNDIYANGKKLGGLLIENRLVGDSVEWAVAGVGLNVQQREFKGLNATSLAILGTDVRLDELAQVIGRKIDFWVTALANGRLAQVKEAYMACLFQLGQQAPYARPNGDVFLGTILNVTSTGYLVMQVEGDVETFDLKEIEWRGQVE